jgi:hypothetical protein
MLKKAIHSKTWIVKIPYGVFHRLLTVWAFFDKNPPFTTQQLEALVGQDEFEMIDWPSIFGVSFTPLVVALKEVHGDPRYSSIVLEF